VENAFTFTSLRDKRVETGLRRQMDLIVEETKRVYGPDCSIILAGSFGRGEGSVRIMDGGNPVPLNDYDVYVITNKSVDPRIHLEMEERIVRELGQLIGYNLAGDEFIVGVEVVPRRSLNRLTPDISTYEMKAASQVLYGPDVRGLIRLTSDEIALGSGAITLFHRAIALLENVEPEYLASEDYPEDRRLETVRETCKVYTEICTSLSLIGGFYKPSYRARAHEFASHYDKFPELASIIPDLPAKVVERTELKIKSDFTEMKDEAEEKWIEARRDLDVCQRYFLSRMLSIKFDQDWKNFCNDAEKKLKWLFFYDYLALNAK
jgi:predicted nucleotidyltransferase